MWAWLAVWLAVAGPFSPDLPPLEIAYLGAGAAGNPRPDGIAGLLPSAPDKAVAIVFRGGFDLGGTAALAAALDAAPLVRLVAFDSPGGRPLVADGVAQVIRARHLDTTVNALCASACTIAYLAGTVRTAGPRARFGFHLGTGPVLAGFAAKVVLQFERKWFIRGDASLSFAERALHAPNLNVYVAPHDELIAAGYLHRLLGTPVPARFISNDPLLQAVTKLERLTGEALVRAQGDRARSGMAAARSAAIAEQRAGLVVDRWLARSSDTAVLDLADATLAALEWLGGHDAPACMRWRIGRDDQDLSLSLLPPDIRAAFQAAQIGVVADANAYPLPVPVDDGLLAARDAVIRRDIGAVFGPQALAVAASPEHGFDDPSRSCSAGTAYVRRLRGEGARMLRWALAAG